MHSPPYTIGITGGSGSGKSFFLEKLKQDFSADEIAILAQDNYYIEREKQQRDENGIPNFDLPDSFYMEEFLQDLQKLQHGEAVTRLEYGYNSDIIQPEVITIEPAPVLVVEGLFLLHDPEIRKHLDVSVYISVSDVLKLKRRILRDRENRNYPLEDILYRYEHHVLPAFNKYIKPFKSEANIVVNNNDAFEQGVGVISGYIRSLLKKQC